MAELEQMQIGGVIPATVWNMQTASASQIDSVCGLGKGKNLLDNGYWVGGGSQLGEGQFPINQRGQLTYQGNLYGIDRWIVFNQTTLTLASDGIILKYPDTPPSGTYLIYQPLEDVNRFIGKTMTLSALVSEVSNQEARLGVQFRSDYVGNTGTQILSPGLITITFTVPQNANSMGVFITDNSKKPVTLKVVAIKLELGDTQTLAHQDENGNWVLSDPPPDYTLELLKCMRYQEDTGFIIFAPPFTSFNWSIPWRIIKRTNPTVTIYSLNGTAGKVSVYRGTTWIEVDAFLNEVAGTKKYGIWVSVAGLNAGEGVCFKLFADSNP